MTPLPDGGDALDQSFSFADPKAAKAAGVKAVMMYLSPDPAKNISPAKVKAYHAVGIGVWVGWESTAGRALQGAAAGGQDGAEAVRQLRLLIEQVGYSPANKLAIDFAVDFDTNPAQYPTLDAYLTAAGRQVRPAGFLNGVYAEADYVEHTAGRKITDQEYQTYAWSGGRVADAADVLQYLNTQRLGGADVDFDKLLHPKSAGIWWPPNHPNNTADEGEMSMSDKKEILDAIAASEGRVLDRINHLFSHGDDGDPDQLAAIVRQELRAVGLRPDQGKGGKKS